LIQSYRSAETDQSPTEEEDPQVLAQPVTEHLQDTETPVYKRTTGFDRETEYRNESILLQKEAEKERTTTRNFKRAEELFKKALRLWRGNETAAKNYATMLRHQERTREAIAVLEDGVQYAQERLPIYNLLTNCFTDIGQYGKAREYGYKALRLVGDARAEIGVLTSIYSLEIKAHDFRKAHEHAEAILRLNPNHEQMRKNKKRLEDLLAGDTQPTENLYEMPETVTELNIEISLLIREDLENCELTKVSPRILNNRTISSVLGECERLQDETRKLHSQQHRERADYFLQSAKLVSQLLSDSKQSVADERETDQVSENAIRRLEKELGDALCTYTGVMGDRYYAQGNMDSARDYYLEHVRVYKQTLPLLPRRRIAKYFQSFIPERIDLLSKIPDNESRQAHYVILEIIDTTLRAAESGIHEDVARGVLELACTSHLIVEYITRAIRTNTEHRQMFQLLIDILMKQQSAPQPLFTNLNNERPEEVFAHLVNNRQVSVRQQESQLSNLIGSVGDRYRLVEAEREMNWFADLQREWSKTDRSFFLSLRDLVRESTQYFHQEGQFSDREHLVHSIITRADSLRKRLDSEPTSLGKTYIARIVYQLKRLIENAFQELQQSSLPILTARVVQTRWSKYNLERECHIEIINEGESPAIEVSLHILPSETGDYADDPKVHQVGSVFSRPHAVTVAIPVVLQTESDQITMKDAVDLRIRMDYHDRERVKKETPPTRLRLSLRDEVQFTRIVNPYQTGLPIVDARMFMGRQELLEELATEMTHAGRTSAVVIYGQKRSGKTSILRNLETYLATHKHETYDYVIPVSFSMQSVLTKDELMTKSLFYLIAQEVSQKCFEAGLEEQVGELTWEQLEQPPNPETQFRTYLNKIRKLLSTRLVLLIDEFTELSARIDEGHIDRNIMKYLKALIEQGFFSCVICGIDTMPQVLSKYANELAVSDPRTVGYLSHEAARQLIEEPIMLPNGQSRYTSPQVVEELIRLTAGSPYYIQFICHRLVEYMNRETRSPTITGADVDRVVRSLISSLDPYTKFDNLTRYRGDKSLDTYETTLEGLFLYLLADEARQRPWVAFSAICQRAAFVNEAEFLDIADQLETRQVIERSEGATRQFKIVVDLFRRWINVRRPIDDEALTRFRLQLKELRSLEVN
jgi:tetratricopeptide (TPR) repeat protein